MPPQTSGAADPLGSSRVAVPTVAGAGLPVRTVVTGATQYKVGGSYVAAPRPAGGSYVAAPQYKTATSVGPGSFVAAPGALRQATLMQGQQVAAPQPMPQPAPRTVTAPASYQVPMTTTSSSPAAVVTMAGAPAAQPQTAYTARSLSTAQPMMGTMRQLPGPSAEYVAALERRLSDLEVYHACRTHSAVVFIKPHAVTDRVKELVKDHLKKFNISILSEGEIPAEEIDSQQLIDTHYGAIAEKAVKLKPAELTVQPAAQAKFKDTFVVSWQEALAAGSVYNAMDAAKALGIDGGELGKKWAALKNGVDLIKFGGGFYCGKIDNIYVINAFYMDMRNKFTAPGTCIYIYETEWDPRSLTWEDFRGKVLGGTDPSAAADGSLRKLIYENWSSLSLGACPTTGNNSMHASASPLEALAERRNWLSVQTGDDFFGRALLASGMTQKTIESWCQDPLVKSEGEDKSLFDLLEDLDARDCLRKCATIAAENTH